MEGAWPPEASALGHHPPPSPNAHTQPKMRDHRDWAKVAAIRPATEHQRARCLCSAGASSSKLDRSLDSSSAAPDLRVRLCCESNVCRAIFQMFETRSTPLWPRSDAPKLGGKPPVFSWPGWINKSDEDSIVVWPSAADSSICDPSINKEHRPVRRPANCPHAALAEQHLDPDGTHTHTHISYTCSTEQHSQICCARVHLQLLNIESAHTVRIKVRPVRMYFQVSSLLARLI